MHAAAERRQAADAPVAELIAHALDHNRAIIRDLLRRELLISEITQNILGRLLIEIVLARQPGNRSTARQLAQFANQRADAPAELNRPAGLIPVPEWHLARLTGRRAHQHTILRDLVDAPRGRAQHKRLTHARLEHHLLIELTDTQRFRVPSAHEDSIQATIRNRAAIEDGNPMHTLARCNPVSLPVPRHPRTQFCKLV